MMEGSTPPVPAALAKLEDVLGREGSLLLLRGFGNTGLRGPLRDEKSGDDERADLLREARVAQAEFLRRLDEFQRVKQVYFMQAVSADLAAATTTIEGFYGGRLPRHPALSARRLAGRDAVRF
jgi:hypothetical protein